MSGCTNESSKQRQVTMEGEGDEVSKPQKLKYLQNTKGNGVLLTSDFFFPPALVTFNLHIY